MKRSVMTRVIASGLALILAGCSGDYGASEDTRGPTGPSRNPNSTGEGVFGTKDGVSLSDLTDGTVLGSDQNGGNALPVNRYLWRASLQTLDFMPLVSTDPFTGVIATDWSTPPGATNERVKVTVYVTNPELSATALKVAVFREVRGETGIWQPAPVNPDTPRQLEDAILTKARQIKIAELEGSSTG